MNIAPGSPGVDMQRYWLPGYELQLLEALQRQQNSAQFCDTLLQTEGISVPTHSCVLAALSPYLSQELSAAPRPPPGQERRLRLQAVDGRTLLKLVGLLYSGQLEVKGSVERDDVLAAARRFGVASLVKGQEGEKRSGACSRCGGREEARGETGACRRMRDAQVQAGMAGGEVAQEEGAVVKRSFVCAGTQTVKPDGTFVVSGQPKPPAPEPPPPLAGGAALPRSPPPPRSATLASPPHSAARECGSPNPTSSSEAFDAPTVLVSESADGRDAPAGVGMSEDAGEGEEQPKPPEGRRVSAHVGVMKHVMETTHISIKVKLRRRRKGEVWEVVSTDETLSLLTSLTQDGSNRRNVSREPASARAAQPAAAAAADPPHSPPRPDATSRSRSPRSSDATPSQSQSGELASPPPPHPRGPVGESDERMRRLLEDIMTGLNILPDLQRDSKRFDDAQPIHGGATAADCARYRGRWKQKGHSATHAAGSLSSTQPDDVLVQEQQQQQQQHSPQHHSSGRASTRSLPLSGFYSRWKKLLHYPAFQAQRPQEEQNTVGRLPVSDGDGTQPSPPRPSPSMADVRLPRCLSPLQSLSSAEKHRPVLDDSASRGSDAWYQRSLKGRPRLAGHPSPRRVPRRTVTLKEDKLSPSHQDAGPTHHPMRCQELNSEPRRMNSSRRGGEDGSASSQARRRRRKKRHGNSTGAVSSVSARKKTKVADGTQSQIKLNGCSVSLQRISMLAKEQRTATGSPKVPSKYEGGPNQRLSMTESLKERTRGTRCCAKLENACHRRSSTRGFLRKTQGMLGNTSPDSSSAQHPLAPKATETKALVKQKRGRPTEEHLPKIDLENGVETKRRGEKRTKNGRAGVVPPKRTRSGRSAADAGDHDVAQLERTLRRPKSTVSLKEFQKPIQRRHLTRKSTENMDSGEPAGDKGTVPDDGVGFFKEPTEETKSGRGAPRLQTPGTAEPWVVSGVAGSDGNWLLHGSRAETAAGIDVQRRPETTCLCRDDVPQTPLAPADRLSSAGAPCTTEGFHGSAGSSQEEQEEAEVDVLRCSPDKLPGTAATVPGRGHVVTSPDDDDEEREEEEDVDVIDVTGDEAD